MTNNLTIDDHIQLYKVIKNIEISSGKKVESAEDTASLYTYAIYRNLITAKSVLVKVFDKAIRQ